ncbi:MAG: peptidoglycan bridge formation glycyltransferase FemA/FemB family protein [Candidatus Pacearchaeota archaeon]|nr:peptidoglycan bridge formation glycyltransferase FemA/FemB family protein [Candidatus Pacearchaeota archaeon]
MNEIIRLNEENKGAWEEFAGKSAETRIYHSLKFMQAIKESYPNCKDYYFLCKSGKIDAIFPFFLVKSRIFGNRLICVPFLDSGNFLGEYTPKLLKDLIEILKKDIKKIRHIEVRLNTSYENFDKTRNIFLKTGFGEEKKKHQFIIYPKSKEDMWERFHKHTRNDIRKSQKSGLEIKKIDNKEELKKFYEIYLTEMKNFGTPQHSYKFFEKLFDCLGDSFVGFNCYLKNNLAGSLIMYYSNNHAYISFNVSSPEFRNCRPNDLLYWTAITWLIGRGVKDINLGQVEKNAPKGSHAEGLYKFKEKWLGELYERIYFYWPEEEHKIAEDKNKYGRFRKIWMHLPLPIIKKIGPKVCSELGI